MISSLKSYFTPLQQKMPFNHIKTALFIAESRCINCIQSSWSSAITVRGLVTLAMLTSEMCGSWNFESASVRGFRQKIRVRVRIHNRVQDPLSVRVRNVMVATANYLHGLLNSMLPPQPRTHQVLTIYSRSYSISPNIYALYIILILTESDPFKFITHVF